MDIRAAVALGAGQDFAIQTLRLEAPRPDEMVVRIVACGICQTDAHSRDQHMPVPLPAVLGHEGAGIVEHVGAGVSDFAPGDHVVLSYRHCGRCRPCLAGAVAYCEAIFPLNFGGARLDGSTTLERQDDDGCCAVHGQFFGQSSFATHALVNRQNAIRVRSDVPLAMLAPFGCGLQTGYGAVVNSLNVRTGRSIAIIGTGAVGLTAVMAAKIVGASRIIAIDINDQRLALAREFGATDLINSAQSDAVDQVLSLSGGGVDYTLEVTGRPELAAAAVDMLAPLGVAGLIGTAPPGTTAPFEILKLLLGRTVRGIHQGDAVSKLLIPQMVDHFAAGRFPIDRLIKTYAFEDINIAFRDAATGKVVKPVLTFTTA